MKGIITYVYLENFVTYNSVVLKPGRNLNVIIGPNGTGKSTILCAIVLGLGGKTSTIGRALHVHEYIRAGCHEATIEIHLKSESNTNVIVKRVFNMEGKSMWYLNGQSSSIKKIQELTKSLNIQIDNLCQFLPQDKVQDFSKMNAQELLQSTERSVADPILLEHHMQLIGLRNTHKELEMQVGNKTKLLESRTQVYNGLKESVSTIKERKIIKKKIETLNQKKAWMLYDEMRKELLKLKTKHSKVIKSVSSLSEKIKPINDEVQKISATIKQLESSLQDHSQKINLKSSKLKRIMDSIFECQNSINECENVCKQRIEVEKSRGQDIERAEQQREKLSNDLCLLTNDIGSEETLMERRQEISNQIEKQKNIINALTNESTTLKQQQDQLSLETRSLQSEAQMMQIESKRLQLLRDRSSDSYRAVLWLRENRNKFSTTIHEPMLLNINVKDASYARYLEDVIPHRDLIAFTCETKQDMNLLLRYLRDEQKLQINAVHSDPQKNVSMEPKIPLEHIRQYGFTHYLISLIEAPLSVLKYLVSTYHLNNIPIGTATVEDNIERIPNALFRYFSANNAYSVNVSKYTGSKSTRMQAVSRSGTLSIVLDKSKMLALEEQLKRVARQKNEIIVRLKELEETVHGEHKKLDDHRTERNKYQQTLQQIQALKSRISMAEKKVNDLRNERTSVREIKESCSTEIKALVSKELTLYNTYNTEMKDYFNCVTEREQIKLTLTMRKQEHKVKTDDSQDLRDQLRAVEDELRRVNSEIQPLRASVQENLDQALKTTNGFKPSDAEFAPINKAFAKLPPTIEEINHELDLAQAKVFCMSNNMDAESVLREYDQVKTDMENLETFIKQKTRELETTARRMETLREEWLSPLQEIVDEINKNFSEYFSAMNCAGEVVLHHGENIVDFDQYGLKIRVKFRDTDELQELTRHHQSGGERAVTTAIYMISLQELSKVPFRCVDEINQGMDEVNERRVFNLLVKMTGRPNSSQYFLITPKLLPNLEYSETVTVHCVFNGPFVISHTEFDMDEYCRRIVAEGVE